MKVNLEKIPLAHVPMSTQRMFFLILKGVGVSLEMAGSLL